MKMYAYLGSISKIKNNFHRADIEVLFVNLKIKIVGNLETLSIGSIYVFDLEIQETSKYVREFQVSKVEIVPNISLNLIKIFELNYRFASLCSEETSGKLPLVCPIFSDFKFDFFSKNKYLGNLTEFQYADFLTDFCKNYVDDFSGDSVPLFFSGGTGSGKTYMSLIMAKAIQDNGYKVYYDSWSTISHDLINYHMGRSDRNIMKNIMDADLLIVDDLGYELNNKMTDAHLFDLINKCVLHGKPIIIISALTYDVLLEKYTEKIVSRIFSFQRVMFPFEDMRRKFVN